MGSDPTRWAGGEPLVSMCFKAQPIPEPMPDRGGTEKAENGV
jgi:hypothetical protein